MYSVIELIAVSNLWMRWTFGCARILASLWLLSTNFYWCDAGFFAESEGPVSTNMVVICKARLFVFSVLDSSGYVITAPEIEQQLRSIYSACAGRPEGLGIGALTAENRTTWWKVNVSGNCCMHDWCNFYVCLWNYWFCIQPLKRSSGMDT